MPTARTIIANALQECGAYGVGETVSADDEAQGLSRLNRMLDAWRNRNIYICARAFDTYSWTSGQASRTIGPTGNFAVTVRPLRIYSAAYVDGDSNRFPINVQDVDWWRAQVVRTLTSSIPTDLYYAPTVPNGTLYLLPYPSATVNIELETDTIISTFATAATSVNLAPGHEEAITQSLAELLCSAFEREVTAQLMQSAMRARADIVGPNTMAPLISLNGGRRGFWDYLTGRRR